MRGAIPPLPQYAFMAWCLVKHRDNFTFYISDDTEGDPVDVPTRHFPREITGNNETLVRKTSFGFRFTDLLYTRYMTCQFASWKMYLPVPPIKSGRVQRKYPITIHEYSSRQYMFTPSPRALSVCRRTDILFRCPHCSLKKCLNVFPLTLMTSTLQPVRHHRKIRLTPSVAWEIMQRSSFTDRINGLLFIRKKKQLTVTINGIPINANFIYSKELNITNQNIHQVAHNEPDSTRFPIPETLLCHTPLRLVRLTVQEPG
jgi:hypothetical protein